MITTEQIKEAYGESYVEDLIDKDGFCPYLNDGMIEVGIKPFGNHERKLTVGGYVWRPIQLTIIQVENKITLGGKIAIEERRRQIEDLGYDYTHDHLYADEQLAKAGAIYALPKEARQLWWGNDWVSLLNRFWPWDLRYWKPTPEDRIKELGKAAALIIAQIDYELNKQK